MNSINILKQGMYIIKTENEIITFESIYSH